MNSNVAGSRVMLLKPSKHPRGRPGGIPERKMSAPVCLRCHFQGFEGTAFEPAPWSSMRQQRRRAPVSLRQQQRRASLSLRQHCHGALLSLRQQRRRALVPLCELRPPSLGVTASTVPPGPAFTAPTWRRALVSRRQQRPPPLSSRQFLLSCGAWENGSEPQR